MISFAIALLAVCIILMVETTVSNTLIVVLAVLAGILAFLPAEYIRRN